MRKSVLPWLACVIAALIAIPAFASGAAVRGERTAPTVASAPVAAPTVTFKTASAPAAGVADAAYLVVNQEFIVVGGEPGDTEVFINAGEKVTWTQGDNDGTHNVEFNVEQPNSCVQLEGFPTGHQHDGARA